MKSIDEAVGWTTHFLEVLGEGECEIRPVFEPSDFGEEFTPEQREAEERQRARMAGYANG